MEFEIRYLDQQESDNSHQTLDNDVNSQSVAGSSRSESGEFQINRPGAKEGSTPQHKNFLFLATVVYALESFSLEIMFPRNIF
jgi:hypothetical protein